MYEPIETLHLTCQRHPDGCLILTGFTSRAGESRELYGHYRGTPPLRRILMAIAMELELLETGELDEELLADALALPFD